MSDDKKIPVFIMGKRYEVPGGLTILKAIEYAGYRLIRGCGCRSGFCGACATVYRIKGEPRLRVALACQTLAQPNMYLAQLPSFPSPRSSYQMDKVSNPTRAVLELYPEILRCMGCGACNRACPQELEVKEYVAAISKGDLERAAQLSFDCLMCGLCAARCPVGIVPYNAGMFARRAYGLFLLQEDKKLREMVEKIKAGKYETEMNEMMQLDEPTLKELYEERDFEAVKEEEVFPTAFPRLGCGPTNVAKGVAPH